MIGWTCASGRPRSLTVRVRPIPLKILYFTPILLLQDKLYCTKYINKANPIPVPLHRNPRSSSLLYALALDAAARLAVAIGLTAVAKSKLTGHTLLITAVD